MFPHAVRVFRTPSHGSLTAGRVISAGSRRPMQSHPTRPCRKGDASPAELQPVMNTVSPACSCKPRNSRNSASLARLRGDGRIAALLPWAAALMVGMVLPASLMHADVATNGFMAFPNDPPWVNPDVTASWLAPVLSAVAGRFGVVLQILTVIATLRTVFKPLMGVLESVVAGQPAQAARLARVEESVWFKALAFLLDLGASVKLRLLVPAKASPVVPTAAGSPVAVAATFDRGNPRPS